MSTSPLTSTAPLTSAVAARIVFREPVSATGFIDAAWWPRSLDLALELPPLLDVLWDAGREITRITYAIAAWDPAPRRLRFRGNAVHLGGFVSGDAITVRLTDAWRRERIDVLVLAPSTDPEVAARALEIAGRTGNPLRAAEILSEATGVGAPA